MFGNTGRSLDQISRPKIYTSKATPRREERSAKRKRSSVNKENRKMLPADLNAPRKKKTTNNNRRSACQAPELTSNVHFWTVSDVYDFIRMIPGCASYADEFIVHQVDGTALLLMELNHLMLMGSMKLGPAIKIASCISALNMIVTNEVQIPPPN